MKWYIVLGFLLIISLFTFCRQAELISSKDTNPHAEDFNIEDSDSMAIAIADKVMVAQGGRHNWNATTYFKWNFFGSRLHIWNKENHDYIIKGLRDTFIIKGNLKTGATDLILKGVPQTHIDSLTKYGEKAKSMWINDAYWLVMPYKLKDSGVTLRYGGVDTTLAGEPAHRLKLTFDGVGDTPDNMYHVMVDTMSHLVNQWDFYRDATDTIPRFQLAWTDYKRHGELLLSSGRGNKYELTEIEVGDSLAHYFTKVLDKI